jgi:hypothetical protein
VHSGREGEPVRGERLDCGAGGSGASEGGEQVPDGVAHALVGIEHHPAGGVIDQADGQRHDELAAAGLGQLTAPQAGLEEVQLSLLCRPGCYADRGWVGVGGNGMQAAPVGIIYRLLT